MKPISPLAAPASVLVRQAGVSFTRCCHDQSGTTAIEYALIAGFASIVIFTGASLAGDHLIEIFGALRW